MALVSGYEIDLEAAFDARVFEQLYRHWHPNLVLMCRSLLGDGADAEAMAQEAFLRAWSAWARYSPDRPFWPWVATIARRICLDEHRRTAPQLVRLGDVELEATGGLDEAVEADEELRLACAVVHDLRPAERRALVLLLRGWSYRRIAATEETSVEAVRSSLRQARRSLRRSLAAASAATGA